MNGTTLNRKSAGRVLAVVAIALVALGAAGACSHLMMMTHGHDHRDIALPAADEFGFGPRESAGGAYRAIIEPAESIRVGKLHGWTLRIEDMSGQAVDGVEIAVDGGMPQHGHGLPTAPAVTQALGGGQFLIEGMKFNMPGWWEIDLTIEGPAGPDTITFNLVL